MTPLYLRSLVLRPKNDTFSGKRCTPTLKKMFAAKFLVCRLCILVVLWKSKSVYRSDSLCRNWMQYRFPRWNSYFSSVHEHIIDCYKLKFALEQFGLGNDFLTLNNTPACSKTLKGIGRNKNICGPNSRPGNFEISKQWIWEENSKNSVLTVFELVLMSRELFW